MSTSSMSTIRVITCLKLVPSDVNRCSECQNYRPQLTTRSSRLAQDEPLVSPKRNTPNIHLSRKDLEQKVKDYQRDRRALKQSNQRLQKKITKMSKQESVSLGEEINDIISNVARTNSPGFDENSPKYLLWEQQKKMSNLKSKTSMRWHPVMIRWCLSIYLKSPGIC